MLSFLKFLATSGVVGGAMKARLRAAKQTAAVVSVLAVAGLVAATVGLACLAGALYLALLRVMTDYEAALAVGGGFFMLAGIVLLLARARVRRALSGERHTERDTVQRASAAPSADGSDPLVALISESVQSPVVMSALALGVVVGRMTRRSKRDD